MDKNTTKNRIWDASKLKRFRIEAKLKQKDAASALGIAPEWLSSIEHSHQPASNDLICRMAELYKCRIFDLAFDKFTK